MPSPDACRRPLCAIRRRHLPRFDIDAFAAFACSVRRYAIDAATLICHFRYAYYITFVTPLSDAAFAYFLDAAALYFVCRCHATDAYLRAAITPMPLRYYFIFMPLRCYTPLHTLLLPLNAADAIIYADAGAYIRCRFTLRAATLMMLSCRAIAATACLCFRCWLPFSLRFAYAL